MNLLPPVYPDREMRRRAIWGRARVRDAFDTWVADAVSLFSNVMPTRNSFGSNEVWAYYSDEWCVARNTFFPEVAIFSSKIRLVDLYRRYHYACHSEFAMDAARALLANAQSVPRLKLLRMTHPYVMIENSWHRTKICAELNELNHDALIFLPKSTPSLQRGLGAADLAAAIQSCRRHAANVSLCVYYQDLERYRGVASDGMVRLVSCGSRYDALFYFRLNLLISLHRFVAYFEPGTHSLYAAYSNKPQLLLAGRVLREFSDERQKLRFPSQDERKSFDVICASRLSTSEPRMVPELKCFLNVTSERAISGCISPRYWVDYFRYLAARRNVRVESCA